MKLTNELWHEWKNLVYKIAKKRLSFFTSFGYEIEDLVQIGAIGLNNGITHYKENRDCSIISFLYHCIDREILKELQHLRRDKRCINKDTVSLELPVSNDTESLTIEDMIEDESIDISNDVEEKLMKEFIISEMKRCLTGEEYIILYLRIIRGFSIQEVLKFMNINKKKSMTRSKVIDLETKAKKDLARKSTYFKEKYKYYISEIESKIDFKYMASAEDVAMERLGIMNKFNLLKNITSDEPM